MLEGGGSETTEADGIDLGAIGAAPLAGRDPERIGPFPLLGVLGSGGMGRVYLASTPVGYGAVKQILPQMSADADFLRRFGQELDNQARVPAGVSAKVLASDRTAQPPWFATEYVPGVTVHDAAFIEGGSLPAPALWMLLRELAARLVAVHALGMTHRDLKPSNVMLTADGLRLIDFGIARAGDQSSVTGAGHSVGTLAYTAPEQASGQDVVTTAADVYALASTLVFAATGHPPFGEIPAQALYARLMTEKPDLAAVRTLEPDLAGVLEACFTRDPAARPSAAQLHKAAVEHIGTTAAQWPNRAMAKIYERRAFADAFHATGPISLEVLAPTVALGPSTAATVATPRPGRRRRRFAPIPIVIVLTGAVAGGAYLLTTLTPWTSGMHAQGGGSSQALAAVQPSGSASVSASASATGTRPAGTPTTLHGIPDGSATSPGAAALSSTASIVTRTTPAPVISTNNAGSKGGPSTVSTSNSLLKNVALGTCLTTAYPNYDMETCSASTSSEGWKAVYSGSAFELVSEDGYCMTGHGENSYVDEFPCGTESDQDWKVGTSTTQGSTLESVAQTGTCLEYNYNGLFEYACNAPDTGQIWYDGGVMK